MLDVDRNLIFDLGMHRGLDTKFYLDKGFRVVALEANPVLASKVAEWLAPYVESRQLQIVEKALTDSEEQTVSFYVNPVKDDWSSTHQWWAEKGAHPSEEITVPVTNMDSLFQEFGTPYYIKCDIEGEDVTFVKQACSSRYRPKYISVEAIDSSLIDILSEGGYSSFQIVNQSLNFQTKAPVPALEGEYADVTFDGHMSGLFGLELPSHLWVSAEIAKDIYAKFMEVHKFDPNLAFGWLDFHARLE